MVVVLTTTMWARQDALIAVHSHLGSDIFAECLTRPQYVERSCCDTGSSRLPGSEADIDATDSMGRRGLRGKFVIVWST